MSPPIVMQPNGSHIIADFFDCDLSSFAPSEASLAEVRAYISDLLCSVQLNELGSHYHFFSPAAVTAVICLAESHLSFHTWPEHRYVSFDIFVCNRTLDARQAAQSVLEELSESLFKVGEKKIVEIERAERGLGSVFHSAASEQDLFNGERPK